MVSSNAGDKVKLTITSNSPDIPSGEQGDIPMLVRVEAPVATKKHLPVDLVALLDVSDTMNHEVVPGTTRLDLLKKAMKFVIKNLHEDDGLAIVPFNEHILTNYATDIFRMSGQRAFALNKVEQLVAKGETLFCPGLEKAVEILDERSDKSRVGVVLLLTDGLEDRKAVKYPIPPEVLKEYPVHTVGIFAQDPNLLLSIAQQSRGTYSFVDDKELANMADPLAVLLGGLSTIVAVDVVVRLTCNYSCWKSAVKRVDCGFQSSEITQPQEASGNDNSAAEIRIGMLYAGEVKNFIAHVLVDPGSKTWMHPNIVYKDAPGGSSIYGEHQDYLHTGKQAGDATANSHMVRGQMVQFSALEFLSTFQADLKKNTAAAKGAAGAKAALIRAGSSLETRWAEFMKTMDDDDLMDDLDRLIRLHDLNSEVKEMASRLKAGAGMAYMCSWLSSQQMQRATTLGSAEAVGAQSFFTPAMEDKLREARKYQEAQGVGGGGGGGGGSSNLQQRREAWDRLMDQANKMFKQPPDSPALEQARKDLNTAINKAKKKDLNEAMARGET